MYLLTHPKVNFKISTPTEFSIADLERDCHLVVLVELLMEAFPHVCLHLNVVSGNMR